MTLYYEVRLDYDTGMEVIEVYREEEDGDRLIASFTSFKELFKKYPAIPSREFLDLIEELEVKA